MADEVTITPSLPLAGQENTKPTSPIGEVVVSPVVPNKSQELYGVEPVIIPEPALSSPPAKGEMPEAEGVSVSEPVIIPKPAVTPDLPIEEPVVPQSPIVEEAPIENTPAISPEPVVSSTADKEEQRGSIEPAEPIATQAPIATTPEPPRPVVTEKSETLYGVSKLDRISLAFRSNMARARELLVKARMAIQLRKRKKIDKVMTLFLKKSKIINKDVRDLLHITDETATVYLNTLMKEGKIKKEGKGGSIYYTKGL